MKLLRLCEKFISTNKKFMIQFLVITTLVSITVYDTGSIIKDYYNDNSYTLVKLSHINDTFPFLENATVRVSINFYPHTIFPEMWINKTYALNEIPSAYKFCETFSTRFKNQIQNNVINSNDSD